MLKLLFLCFDETTNEGLNIIPSNEIKFEYEFKQTLFLTFKRVLVIKSTTGPAFSQKLQHYQQNQDQ